MRFPRHLTAILLVLYVVFASCAPQGDHLTRVDGSRVSYSDIDEHVRRIMEAAGKARPVGVRMDGAKS